MRLRRYGLKSLITRILIYVLFSLKVFLTIGIFYGQIDSAFTPLSIVAILYCFALAYDPKFDIVAISLLLLISIILLLTLITIALGIKFRSVRKVPIFLITTATLIDFIASFLIYSIVLKTKCILVSTIMLIMCLRACSKNKR